MKPLRIDDQTELRVLQLADAEPLYALVDRNRDHLRNWMTWLDATDSASVVRAFIRGGLRQVENDTGFQAGIWHTGDLVGALGLHRMDAVNRSTSIGYWLSRESQGKGIMAETVRAVTDYCFGDLRLHRVEIRCAVDNARSRAVAERARFEYEGILRGAERHGERYVDHAVYGRLATD